LKNKTLIDQNLKTRWGITKESSKKVLPSMSMQENKNHTKKEIKLGLECVVQL